MKHRQGHKCAGSHPESKQWKSRSRAVKKRRRGRGWRCGVLQSCGGLPNLFLGFLGLAVGDHDVPPSGQILGSGGGLG